MLRLAFVVSLVACGSDAPLKIEAKGVVLPNGKARIDVVTAAGAKVSTGVNPDDAVKADSKGLATIEIPADRIREHDVNVSAELGERYGSTEVVFAPLLHPIGDGKVRCLGPIDCSVSIEYTTISVGAAVGTVVRVAGTELEVAGTDFNATRFRLDPIKVADLLGVSALRKDKPVALPVEVELPGKPVLRGTLRAEPSFLLRDLAERLAQIASKPLAKVDAAASGGIVVVQPQNPKNVGAEWVVHAAGAEHPSKAKLIVIGTPTRVGVRCGKYPDVEKGDIVDLTFNVLDVKLQAYDAATGKALAQSSAKASRKCPERTMGSKFFDVAGTEAKVDDAAVLAAAVKLAGAPGRAARTKH